MMTTHHHDSHVAGGFSPNFVMAILADVLVLVLVLALVWAPWGGASNSSGPRQGGNDNQPQQQEPAQQPQR